MFCFQGHTLQKHRLRNAQISQGTEGKFWEFKSVFSFLVGKFHIKSPFCYVCFENKSLFCPTVTTFTYTTSIVKAHTNVKFLNEKQRALGIVFYCAWFSLCGVGKYHLHSSITVMKLYLPVYKYIQEKCLPCLAIAVSPSLHLQYCLSVCQCVQAKCLPLCLKGADSERKIANKEKSLPLMYNQNIT